MYSVSNTGVDLMSVFYHVTDKCHWCIRWQRSHWSFVLSCEETESSGWAGCVVYWSLAVCRQLVPVWLTLRQLSI